MRAVGESYLAGAGGGPGERKVVVFGGKGSVGQALVQTAPRPPDGDDEDDRPDRDALDELGRDRAVGGSEAEPLSRAGGRSLEGGEDGAAGAAEAAVEAGARDPGFVPVAVGREEADVTDPEAVAACLDEIAPLAAVNCAVFQPVDLCEERPDLAFGVNATGARHLARACAERGIPLVHVSTDYVFGGDQWEPYAESDPPRPLSVYAASKLAGEHLVLAASERHLVVRSSSVYGRAEEGHGSAPFVERMIERARTAQPTRVVDDQTVSPTHAADLATAIWMLLGAALYGEGGDVGGVFHVTNDGEATWYELAACLFLAAGRPEALDRTTAEEFGAPARRPRYSALRSERLHLVGIPRLRHWQEALADYLLVHHPDLDVTAAFDL